MALVMSLILAVISLAFASSLLYLGVQGTRMSGLEKRYRTAIGAAKGAVEHSTKVIDYNGNDPAAMATFDDAGIRSQGCFIEKLNSETVNWPAQTICSTLSGDQLTSDVTVAPDMMLALGASPHQYMVSVKVIETIPGNSPPVTGGTGGGQGGIDTKAVVEGGSGSGIIKPMHMPYLYIVEVQSVNTDNADEVAHITYLYEH